MRSKRKVLGGIVYHCFNRANGRLRIFKKPGDFEAFENVLAEAIDRVDMRLHGYCVMGNHWHLVVQPRLDGDLSEFMKWLTGTHSHRWHRAHGTVGIGHVYQGRYRSFPVQSNKYYRTLMRYVEANPQKAKLVSRAVDWQWSSLAIRTGSKKPFKLCKPIIELGDGWVDGFDNLPEMPEKKIQNSIRRGAPFGDPEWTRQTAAKLGLESSIKPIGRPKI
ncbi:Transposase [Limihaloglobus sulfuriphilus]|uniref:Transposase n=1 Tax=Limihaloglobus sulfuriphilus TaxID=1851148 RepID=A0A1Q2MEX2_9BACT|nr:transposase [Limihaloglobus sulfuriphilus]AQQ71204.1 Transposase [Limihaloglobus sulfuriphilus]